MYFPFFILHDWDKRSAEVRSAHCAVLPYTCTREILRSLGQMYIAGDSMTENIDGAGGAGTAEFAHQAIEIYCK